MRRADGRLEQSAVPTGITVTKPAISSPLRDALELLFPLSVDCRELGIKKLHTRRNVCLPDGQCVSLVTIG